MGFSYCLASIQKKAYFLLYEFKNGIAREKKVFGTEILSDKIAKKPTSTTRESSDFRKKKKKNRESPERNPPKDRRTVIGQEPSRSGYRLVRRAQTHDV